MWCVLQLLAFITFEIGRFQCKLLLACLFCKVMWIKTVRHLHSLVMFVTSGHAITHVNQLSMSALWLTSAVTGCHKFWIIFPFQNDKL